jgi:hypothetical protein
MVAILFISFLKWGDTFIMMDRNDDPCSGTRLREIEFHSYKVSVFPVEYQ